MASQINLSQCTPRFTSEDHYDFPERMKFVNGTLTHPTFGEIATVNCIQITRRLSFKTLGDFFELMDAESQELSEFSVAVFDTHSNVYPYLVDGGARSGSGCWGSELSVGDMLYITDLTVKSNFQRRAVGSWLLQKLLDSPHIGYRGIAYAWPTPNSADNEQQWEQERAVITAFYRKNGFRRIGLTSFFAYSPDPSHPSHSIPTSSDPNPPSANMFGPELTPEQTQQQYPLHYAIANNKTPSISNVIRATYEANHASIRQRDQKGFLPLHTAAISENLHAIRSLVELCPAGMAEDSKDRANKDLLTPLEAQESSIRAAKALAELFGGSVLGYSDDSLKCKYLLTRAADLSLDSGEADEAGYIRKRRYGCTCGTCTDGWLSQRMRFRLGAQAALQNDMMRMDTYQFRAGHPLSSSEIIESAFDYIPPPIRHEIYKTFYVGFYTIFEAIHIILDKSASSQRLPYPLEVFTTALGLDARAVQFFKNKGGMMEYVLDATIDMAKEQSSLGDGTFEETFEDEANSGADYTSLPKCANDLEFDLVRRKLGLSPSVRWGPYGNIYDEEGMDYDSDDEMF